MNEKTVRDIWNGRTWIRETFHLRVDSAGAAMSGRLQRRPGRPRGSKDTRPRRRKHPDTIEGSRKENPEPKATSAEGSSRCRIEGGECEAAAQTGYPLAGTSRDAGGAGTHNIGGIRCCGPSLGCACPFDDAMAVAAAASDTLARAVLLDNTPSPPADSVLCPNPPSRPLPTGFSKGRGDAPGAAVAPGPAATAARVDRAAQAGVQEPAAARSRPLALPVEWAQRCLQWEIPFAGVCVDPDDPFHDDWAYWPETPKQRPAAAEPAEPAAGRL